MSKLQQDINSDFLGHSVVLCVIYSRMYVRTSQRGPLYSCQSLHVQKNPFSNGLPSMCLQWHRPPCSHGLFSQTLGSTT